MGKVFVASKMGLIIGDVSLNAPPNISPSERLRPDYVPPSYPVVAGYALTEVDAVVWEKWAKAHHDSDLLKNHIVAAAESRIEIEAWCFRHRNVRTGLDQGGHGGQYGTPTAGRHGI